MITQTYKPTAARPPSITAGGIGAADTVSQARQAYCGRMCRCTKKRAGSTSSCSLMSSPILTSAWPHVPAGAGVRFMHGARCAADAPAAADDRRANAAMRGGAARHSPRLACFLASSASAAARSLASVSWNRSRCSGEKRFAARAKAHPAQVRQLQREGLDLDLGGVKLGVAAADLLAQPSGFGGFFLCLIDEALNGADDPFREFWSGLQADQFSMQIHAIIITDDRTQEPREQGLSAIFVEASCE